MMQAHDLAAAAERAERDGRLEDAIAASSEAARIALLPVLPGEDTPWLDQVRRQLRGTLLQALLSGSRARSRCGDHPGAIAAVEQALALDPFVESAYVRLMGALSASGNPAAALRVYERCRTVLAEELGALPSPEVREAHRRILVRDTAAGAATDVPAIPRPPWLSASGARGFVGREEELALLRAAWSDVGRGHRRVVLVTGEPGIGKTRLVSQLAGEVASGEGIVLGGTCDDALGVPYKPFAEALTRYADAQPSEFSARVGRLPHASSLATLVPRLAAEDHAVRLTPVDPTVDRYLLFEAVRGLVEGLCQAAPVLLVLDDLHWATAPTLLLLRHLLRGEEHLRLLVVALYRDTEPVSPAFSSLLGYLRRVASVRRVALAGLSLDEVWSLVRQEAGQIGQDTRSLAAMVHAETGGNPFFVGELVRSISESSGLRRGGPQPTDDVRAVIAQRFARLPASVGEQLSIAAVVGPTFDPALVRDVTHIEHDDLFDVLDRAERARLVVPAPHRRGSYTFVHALVRSVLYEALPTAARQRAHRDIGRLLASQAAEDDAGAWSVVAHHLCAAAPVGSPQEAAAAARRAGDLARAALGFEDAADHYRAALDMLELLPNADAAMRCDLEIALAEALNRGGAPRQTGLLQRAADSARRIGDRRRLADAALGLEPFGRYVAFGAADAEAVALLEDALASPGVDDGRRARLLVALALELTWTFELDRA